ncbi:MAG: M20/M25/M40 family metallo-hydrolase [Candidatus Calescibacterium sp.]|nr:M20/M25/M40 family metallo-hydrolase [Candidatus Calescibacterium sp.]MCX7971688.1 M20/M25/M40 family metallo-hydrolase [bacterium]MDW8195294.1 M20/M25/M40 family metallo-hydrolase [Candidatus Calescibacterium sp.]
MLEIKDLLFRIVSIPSINSTHGEVEIAEFIYEYLRSLRDSFGVDNENFQVYLQDIRDDNLGRKNVIAVLKGNKEESNRCIVFVGHFDTVDIEDYGVLKDFAFDSVNLKSQMKKIHPDLVVDNVEFGRGILDMKAGIAVNIEVLKRFAQCVDKWSGYLVFLFVCDEEGDSKGMINSLYFLDKVKKEKSLDYLFCIDTDYSVNKAAYVGSIGKVLIGILVRGIETHVGQSLEGLNSNYILSYILSKIEDNEYLVEDVASQFKTYPIIMKVRDMRDFYNVKTNLYSFAYINHLFYRDSIDQIVKKYVDLINSSIREMFLKRKKLMNFCDINYDLIRVHVLDDFSMDLYDCSRCDLLDVKDYRENLIIFLKNRLDSYGINYPYVLVFLLPPYYPSVVSDLGIKSRLSEYIRGLGEDIEIYDYFPYISDLSFLGGLEGIEYLGRNMLGWGRYYYLDSEVMNNVKMPCINWGVIGYDAHKFTERLVVDYSLYRLPGYITDFVWGFLQ